ASSLEHHVSALGATGDDALALGAGIDAGARLDVVEVDPGRRAQAEHQRLADAVLGAERLLERDGVRRARHVALGPRLVLRPVRAPIGARQASDRARAE